MNKYPVKKTRIEEHIFKCESLTKVGYYYHTNNGKSKMFDTLEQAQEYKKEIERLHTQKKLSDYKVEMGELNDFPINIIETLGLDLTSCVNEIENRLIWLFENTIFTKREQFIFWHRFKDYETLEDVSKALGITRERVRQIETKVLKKLKRFSNYLELGEYGNKLELAKKEYKDYVENLKQKWTYESAKQFIEQYESENKPYKNVGNNLEIDDLDLSIRSWNCLKRAGVYEIWQLLQISEEDLNRIGNMGKKSVNEIKTQLAKHDLELPEQSVCKIKERGYWTSFEFKENNENE